MPLAQEEEADQAVLDMSSQGLIEPSESMGLPYCSDPKEGQKLEVLCRLQSTQQYHQKRFLSTSTDR